MNASDVNAVRAAFADALSTRTMQGFALRKPHGYAGDFEIIDRIYLRHITDDPSLKSWDTYYHQQSATKAVRNRKDYFHKLLDKQKETREASRILNVGSGPARCVFEWLGANATAQVAFECIDIDENAVRC